MNKLPVAVLGATGAVGQRLVSLLASHPWFRVEALCASDRSAGKPYGEAVHWILQGDPPPEIARLPVRLAEPVDGLAIAFSALDSSVAGEIESAWATAGCLVSSNSRNHRMEEDVPLLVPEVNGEHLELLDVQRRRRSLALEAGIVTNPNCSTTGLVMALAPILAAFGLEEVLVTTMQAASGAGYPGVPSLDVLGNVIPFIPGEEEKIETETLKILGRLMAGRVEPASFKVSASVNRVPVVDGHLEAVSFRTSRPADERAIHEALESFPGVPGPSLPTAPARPIEVLTARDRPQPARDAQRGAGMTVSVGGLRRCAVLGHKMTVLSHNTLRGAAGAAVLNVEMWLQRNGKAPRR